MDIENLSRKYLDLLQNEFKGINLTRITSKEDFNVKQIEDSLKPFKDFNELREILTKSETVYDLGFGGGFPIIPLAFNYPNKMFKGIEARRKKVNVVGEIANRLDIKNVEFIHSRFQDVHFKSVDFIVSKAMASAEKIMSSIDCEVGATLGLYKGPSFDVQELEDFNKKIRNWKIFFKKSYKLSDESNRTFVLFKKCST